MITQQRKDANAITIIKGILTLKGQIAKTELEKLIKKDDDFDYNDKKIKYILKHYINIHWKIQKTGERNHIHMYSVIDTTADSIDSIQKQISAP